MNKGRITTTKPLPLEVVERIKEHLDESPRELAWFILSTNSAFRGGDVLSIAGTASFGDKNVGTGKTVTATGLGLTGTDAGN